MELTFVPLFFVERTVKMENQTNYRIIRTQKLLKMLNSNSIYLSTYMKSGKVSSFNASNCS